MESDDFVTKESVIEDLEEIDHQITQVLESQRKNLRDRFPHADPEEILDAAGKPVLAELLIARAHIRIAILKAIS